MKNILITSAGKRVVLVRIFQKTVQQLGLDSKIITADANPILAPACIVSDSYITLPKCNDPRFIDTLLEQCLVHNVGLVIPTIDTELLVLSENRERFLAAGIELVLSDREFIRICRDKRFTTSLFASLGIGFPRQVDKFHPIFPMFAKPYDGSLSSNLHVIMRPDDLSREILDDPKLIFMEYIDRGEYKEYTVDMYYGRDSRLKGIVPRERLKIRAGEINKGITRKNYVVEFLKTRMEQMEGVRGCICLQLFYRESDNDIKGIEINPRFGGGFPFSYYAKANFVEYILREYIKGENVCYSDAWLDNTLVLRYDDDVIVYDAQV